MRSWIPGSPWGIFVKSSLPMAFCLMVNGRWSDATAFRVSLRKRETKRRIYLRRNIRNTGRFNPLHNLFLTFPASSLGNWEYWGPGAEVERSRGLRRSTSPGGSTACRSAHSGPWLSHRGPPSLWSHGTNRVTQEDMNSLMTSYTFITLNALEMLANNSLNHKKEMTEHAYPASWPWPLRLRLPCWTHLQDRPGS